MSGNRHTYDESVRFPLMRNLVNFIGNKDRQTPSLADSISVDISSECGVAYLFPGLPEPRVR